MGEFGDMVESFYRNTGRCNHYALLEKRKKQIMEDKDRRFGQRIVLDSIPKEYLNDQMEKVRALMPGDPDYEFYLQKGLFYGEIIRHYSVDLEAEEFDNVCNIVVAELIKVPNGFVILREFNALEKAVVDCASSFEKAEEILYHFCYDEAKAFSDKRGNIPIIDQIERERVAKIEQVYVGEVGK